MAIAQSTWTGAGTNNYWDNTDNWNTNSVPTAADDVIIPTGFTVTLNVAGSVKSINVQGNSVFELNSNLTFTEASVFQPNTVINSSNCTISGNTTLTNNGQINLINGITLSGGSTLNNNGGILFESAGNLNISSTSTLNNTTTGIIDMHIQGGNINSSGVLNNTGLIKKTGVGTGSGIRVLLNNNNGIIQAEEGTLTFSILDKNLNDGIYNVFAGATMVWDTTINPTGTLTGIIDGDLNWKGVLKAVGGTSDITGGTTLENQGILNLFSHIRINDQGSMINNLIGGIIDMKIQGSNIQTSSGSGSLGVLNNFGLIKKTGVGTLSSIDVLMNNNNGTLQAEEGTLLIHSLEKNFNDGIYNVFAGATMVWDTTINPTGTLTGTIDGDLNWTGVVNIPTGQTATFNFSEDDNFNWSYGDLSGGGTLINSNVLKAVVGNSGIIGGATLDNQGVLNVFSNITINDAGSTLNNASTGIIDLKLQGTHILTSTGSGSLGVLNNFGLIKKTNTGTASTITLSLNNSGIINVEEGVLIITGGGNHFTNEVTGIVKGVGVFDLPSVADYTNNGTFAPGLSPGTLTIHGDFVTTATSVLDIELNGLAQGTEYDLLAIQGDAVLEGSINVTMGFVANIDDEFVILTANDITTCNLPSTVTGSFNNMEHTFDVICNLNNITLKVLTIILGSNDSTLETNSIAYPNPTDGKLTIDIGKIIPEITVITSNILGQIIASEKFENTDSIQLIIEGKTGIYFVKLISSEGNSKTLKIIKN